MTDDVASWSVVLRLTYYQALEGVEHFKPAVAKGRFAVPAGFAGVVQSRWCFSELETVKTRGAALCAAFEPGSDSYLVGLRGGHVARVRWSKEVELPQLRMPGDVCSMAFSPKGDRLAIASRTERGALLKVWKSGPFDWEELFSLAYPTEDSNPSRDCTPVVTFSPDGKRLAWSPAPFGDRSDVQIMRGVDRDKLGPFLGVLDAHPSPIHSLAFSPDGEHLVSASSDLIALHCGHSATVLSNASILGIPSATYKTAGFHPTLPLVVVGREMLQFFKIDTSRENARLVLMGLHSLGLDITAAVFSSDGQHLLVIAGGKLLLIFDVRCAPADKDVVRAEQRFG